MQRCLGPKEPANLRRNGSPTPPLNEWVEQQLVTTCPSKGEISNRSTSEIASRTQRTIRVFLPSVQFIVNGERDTLLEGTVGVSGPADDVALHLQAERHIEVFGHVRLGPNFLQAVRRVDEGRILKRSPAKERIVTDEGRDLAVGNG